MQMLHKGAFEMAATVDYLFAYDATPWKTICTKESRRRTCSTHLCRRSFKKEPLGFCGAVVEAHQRGLWQDADQEMVDELRSLVHRRGCDRIKMKVGSLSPIETFLLLPKLRSSSVAFSADNISRCSELPSLMTYPALSIRSLAKL